MAIDDAHCVSWLSHTSTNTNFFPKPLTTFLTCFSRRKWRKYTGKKFRLNLGSNSQPSGHESDTLTTEPPGRGDYGQTVSDGDIEKNLSNIEIGQALSNRDFGQTLSIIVFVTYIIIQTFEKHLPVLPRTDTVPY